MLALEEASMREATVGGDDAMVVTTPMADVLYDNHPSNQSRGKSHKGRKTKNCSNKQHGGAGGAGGPSGTGRGSTRRGGHSSGGGHQMSSQQPLIWMQYLWVVPPCPYPTHSRG